VINEADIRTVEIQTRGVLLDTVSPLKQTAKYGRTSGPHAHQETRSVPRQGGAATHLEEGPQTQQVVFRKHLFCNTDEIDDTFSSMA
jgi:hypothetical protein